MKRRKDNTRQTKPIIHYVEPVHSDNSLYDRSKNKPGEVLGLDVYDWLNYLVGIWVGNSLSLIILVGSSFGW